MQFNLIARLPLFHLRLQALKSPVNRKIHISQALLIGIPFSLCFSHRLNAFIILFYIIAVLFQGRLNQNIKKAFRQAWIYPFLALYLIHIASLFWTEDLAVGLFIAEKKAALFALPIFMTIDGNLKAKTAVQALGSFILGCFAALWFCLFYALWVYLSDQNMEVFFYHNLGYPLDQFNALYFSLYLFTALVFLDYLVRSGDYRPLKNQVLRIALTLSFCLGILLLSSRLFIFITLSYLLFLILKNYKKKLLGEHFRLRWTLGIILLVGGLFFLNFTKDRYKELIASHFEVLQQDQFRWDTPFNGLTLRLLFLKFGLEILDREKAILSGVGAGDARQKMNETIIRYNLYHGNPSPGDKGYLDYNFHNQFMEFWVQIGLPGLAIWFVLLYQSLQTGIRGGWSETMIIFTLVIIGFSFIESMIERQRGVVFAAFFLSLFHLKEQPQV